ncbi:amino acid ABC transporter membrane protein, PAAT family [Gemmobacter megaterium]|uniref:Amino acid ABC transporter membrane protein, PAAT family n=1 Tax=Gemmobacter megaterium TaxID=1086013 RepID=A0A1N7PWY7_9RHOB|nr:amino acid ABC transporter permease [Gemmobacter megaterium]GGE21831.1 ABC transporter permease [Gemmobacter megaterium]SIT14949.1 amino acid ABC transporter membrane protein, PAAT family [Gemmobacter megaterium]
MYSWDFYTVMQSFDLFLIGIWTTFLYTIGSIALGVVIGLAACFARLSRFAALRVLARSYQELFRCTPLLVQILWAYYALPMLLGVSISNTTAGVLTLSLYVGSFYAEIFRGGINAIDKGQREAAAAVGMSGVQSMTHIILPQAVKKMLPAFINQSVIQVKNTSLLYAISVAELTYMTSVVNSETYRPLEAYSLAALMYFVMLFPLTQIADHFERRMRRSD